MHTSKTFALCGRPRLYNSFTLEFELISDIVSPCLCLLCLCPLVPCSLPYIFIYSHSPLL